MSNRTLTRPTEQATAAPPGPSDGGSPAGRPVAADRQVVARRPVVAAGRNRAIDAYRAMAMCAVALGHWLAADVRVGAGGALTGGNALDRLASGRLLTWLFQVMPLFFCIGGYSNAASLSAGRAGSADWVRARLRRLVAPASWLAGVWLVLLLASELSGIGTSVVLTASGVAAIPLWFLANYVADTALSPITLRLFRNHRRPFVGGLIATYLVLESTRFFGIHYLLQANIVLGWLLFQVLGFAWRDGLLPSGRTLRLLGVASLFVAVALVAFGPWPLAMVSVPGARFANTWPPSLALMFYGFGSCALYISAAPRMSAFLERNARAWRLVVVANTMTMTSYLWHFTSIAVAAAICAPIGLLPTAAIGSGAWWLQKLPLMGVALVLLAGLVAVLARKERAGLLAAKTPDGRSAGHAAVCALVLAAGFEIWTGAEGGSLPGVLVGMSLVLVGRVLTRARVKR